MGINTKRFKFQFVLVVVHFLTQVPDLLTGVISELQWFVPTLEVKPILSFFLYDFIHNLCLVSRENRSPFSLNFEGFWWYFFVLFNHHLKLIGLKTKDWLWKLYIYKLSYNAIHIKIIKTSLLCMAVSYQLSIFLIHLITLFFTHYYNWFLQYFFLISALRIHTYF